MASFGVGDGGSGNSMKHRGFQNWGLIFTDNRATCEYARLVSFSLAEAGEGSSHWVSGLTKGFERFGKQACLRHGVIHQVKSHDTQSRTREW